MAEDPNAAPLPRVDLSKPRYDQSTYAGRARHFFETANPFNLFISNRRLEEAKKLVVQYKNGQTPPGTTEKQLWEAKRLYDSAYHPDTGEKMFILGRMSAQGPVNMTVTGCMMTFYKSPAAVIFWQWMNQSINAMVNYTNRSGNEVFTMKQLMVPYVAATGAATATALTLNQIVAKRMPPLVGRYVPFAAVAVANMVNIPLMRQRELQNGIPIWDENDNRVGLSKKAAQKGIMQVTFSRIVLAMPAMGIPPIIMDALEKRHASVFQRMPFIRAPLQVILVGLCMSIATPFCCAIFPQRSSISVSSLEPKVQASIRGTSPHLTKVYFNKGL